VLEVGQGQAEAVAQLLAAGGFAQCVTRPDLAGLVRAVAGYRT
jgi:hypothetical protein